MVQERFQLVPGSLFVVVVVVVVGRMVGSCCRSTVFGNRQSRIDLAFGLRQSVGFDGGFQFVNLFQRLAFVAFLYRTKSIVLGRCGGGVCRCRCR